VFLPNHVTGLMMQHPAFCPGAVTLLPTAGRVEPCFVLIIQRQWLVARATASLRGFVLPDTKHGSSQVRDPYCLQWLEFSLRLIVLQSSNFRMNLTCSLIKLVPYNVAESGWKNIYANIVSPLTH
jgi:hypothetical protein